MGYQRRPRDGPSLFLNQDIAAHRIWLFVGISFVIVVVVTLFAIFFQKVQHELSTHDPTGKADPRGKKIPLMAIGQVSNLRHADTQIIIGFHVEEIGCFWIFVQYVVKDLQDLLLVAIRRVSKAGSVFQNLSIVDQSSVFGMQLVGRVKINVVENVKILVDLCGNQMLRVSNGKGIKIAIFHITSSVRERLSTSSRIGTHLLSPCSHKPLYTVNIKMTISQHNKHINLV
jgi:hypothetical protein